MLISPPAISTISAWLEAESPPDGTLPRTSTLQGPSMLSFVRFE